MKDYEQRALDLWKPRANTFTSAIGPQGWKQSDAIKQKKSIALKGRAPAPHTLAAATAARRAKAAARKEN
jgi:hypothetical protein